MFLPLWHSLEAEESLIQKLIGVALRAIAAHGLSLYALNACETGEDLEEFHTMIERLRCVPKLEREERIYADGFPVLLSQLEMSGKSSPNYLEAETRQHVSDMKFSLLRMEAAVKYHLFTTGEFPKKGEDFSPFLSEGLPEDVFTQSKPMSYKSLSNDEFAVYSVGPDNTDDRASFYYDPTNGTVSPGDILTRIPREREFPFPREGVRAKNAHELLEQFPNGLPADSFADTRGRPFSIIESTETSPVLIFSFGPDTNEFDFTPYTGSSTEKEEDKFEPVSTPPPLPDASEGRLLQWVMRRTEKDPPPPGYWKLVTCPYDPTNGTVSQGDLYIEIPE